MLYRVQWPLDHRCPALRLVDCGDWYERPFAPRTPPADGTPPQRTVVEGFNCYVEFTLHESALLNTARLAPFITSTVSITLALNIIATCTFPLQIVADHS